MPVIARIDTKPASAAQFRACVVGGGGVSTLCHDCAGAGC
ncbi:hypothetical protein BRPE64_CCDS01210 [Caballeronia insecticola]|uniref:Uncharacterized protein n=1 Tax=Caballeronia insecticola TaxID=758793 RepID=R4WNS8_9BURK|nr:hypothetical protein BRPE64_CCDS01210 [Caballeronia insecticola]